MSLFRRLFHRAVPEPRMAEIMPEPGAGETTSPERQAKRERAIAILGDRWCLAGTRQEQIAKLRNEGADLT